MLTRLRVTPVFDRHDGVVYVIALVKPSGESVEVEKATTSEICERVAVLKDVLCINNVEDACV